MKLSILSIAASLALLVSPMVANAQVTITIDEGQQQQPTITEQVVFRASNVKYSVVITQNVDGTYTYSGQSAKGIITLPATQVDNAYVAINGVYSYRVDDNGVLTIRRNNVIIATSHLVVHQ